MSEKSSASLFLEEIIYIYDGSLEGFLCCIYQSFVRREKPDRIYPDSNLPTQTTLAMERVVWIKTQEDKAHNVYLSLARKLSIETQAFVKECFLAELEDKELLLYQFICRGYKIGGKVLDFLTWEPVIKLKKAHLNTMREAHIFTGFIRFQIFEDILIAIIQPHNAILPIIAEHFTDRFQGERFLIYDQPHQMALVGDQGRSLLTTMADFTLPPIDETEKAYQTLWQAFHETIGIKERISSKRQASHVPQRFRKYMMEFRENGGEGRGTQANLPHIQ